jgi:fibronectin type 3 domain-containing protein
MAFASCTSLTSIIFSGLVAPTEYGSNWIQISGAETRGHAYAASNLPPPGKIFNGLIMGAVLPVVPNIPTDLSATPGNAQTVLTWSAPADDGGSAITNYRVYRSAISTGIYSLIASPLGLNFTDTGLINGQTYWYKVSAVNTAGEGAMTSFISSAPLCRVPDAPTGLMAISGRAQVTLNWIAPNDNGGSAVTGYKLYRSTTSGGTYILIASPSGQNYIDLNLTNGQTYWYNVSAVNAAGEVAKAAPVSSTPHYDLPDAPTGLMSVHGSSEVRLNWAAPVIDGGTPITGYKVYRSMSFDGTYTLIASPSITNYTNIGLTNGQTYWYKVSVVNAQGEGPLTAAISSTPVTVPSAQQDLQSTPGTAQATITWQAQASDGGTPITGYKLYRSSTSDGTYSLLAYVSGLTFIDTGLAGGQTYWYKLSAVNEVGEGAQSPAFSIIVPQTVGPTTDNTIVILLEVIAIAMALVVVLILLRKGKQ